MHRCRLPVMWLPLLYCAALTAADVDRRPEHRGDSAPPLPQVRVEYAPATGHADSRVGDPDRPVRKSLLADGTEITHLEGRGMEDLRLLADDEGGPRMVCGAVLESGLARRPAAPIDFRSRTAGRPGGSTDAH